MGRWHKALLMATSSLLLAHGGMAMAQEPVVADKAPGVQQPSGVAEAEPVVGDKISGVFGYDYSSHFVSYGADVWGGGNNLFSRGDQTNFAHGDFTIDFEPFDVIFGLWSDINHNADQSLGGPIQEVDVYAGVGFSLDKFAFSAKYQEWYYASDTERIIDLSVAYDDTGLIKEGFALKPSFVTHIRVDGNGGQVDGIAYVFGVAPSFALTEGDYALTLTLPASVALFSNEFQGGNGVFGYASVGATLGMPLSFIPVSYGAWSAAVNVTYYITDDEAIPGNAESDFFTAMGSISVSF